MLNIQLVGGSGEFFKIVDSELTEEEIPTVTEVKLAGRRSGDKENLRQQIINEDEKVNNLRQEKMTQEQVLEMELEKRPTNDATFTHDEIVILWRDKVDRMIKKAYWKLLNPKKEYKKTWVLASHSVIWINGMPLKSWLGKKVRKEGNIFDYVDPVIRY